MGHLSHHKAHIDLQRRLDQMPASFPLTPQGMEVLRLLFTEDEAAMVARMPFVPTSAAGIARRLGQDAAEVERRLNQLADKGLIFDLYNEKKQRSYFCVAPPVVGFVEFSMMRRRTDVDQPALARAYEAYLGSGHNLGQTLFAGETQIGRTLVHETAVEPDDLAELLTYERASAVVGSAGAWSVSLCYCRHRAEHLGRACDAPLENCMALGPATSMLVRRGLARAISRQEALQILEQSREAGLVFIADNVQRQVSYICSCCGCCCEQLQSINHRGLPGAVKTSAMIATIDPDPCTGCGRCARRCPVQAIQIHALPPHVQRPGVKSRMYSTVDSAICLGCGVCQPVCRTRALTMRPRSRRVLTPEGTLQRILTMALERDRLQNFLFDDQQGLHMLLLNRLTGAILRMPPVKRTLLSQKLRSRFIGFLASGGPEV